MATRVMRVCDVCDMPATGDAVKFGWGASFYETDLCEEHGHELVTLMERVMKTARRLGQDHGAVAAATAAAVPTARKPRVDTAEVRAWAKKKRIKVPDKGRLPESLIAQYLQEGRSS